MSDIYIPPNGFAGFASQTPAGQMPARSGRKTTEQTPTRGMGAGGKRRRRRSKATASKGPRRRTRAKRAGKRAGKLVKGSAAARRFMAQLRAKRRRK